MPVPLAVHIPALYSLANTPLSYGVVRTRCRELGWSIADEDPHNLVLHVQFDNAVSVFIASLGPGQKFGRTIYLPLFFTNDAYDCISGFPADAKPEFDAAYELALSLFEAKIGKALETGTFDFFDGTYRFAMWRGTHAVLALIQDDFDIQFGSEITAWIIECGADDPLPSLPPHT